MNDRKPLFHPTTSSPKRSRKRQQIPREARKIVKAIVRYRQLEAKENRISKRLTTCQRKSRAAFTKMKSEIAHVVNCMV